MTNLCKLGIILMASMAASAQDTTTNSYTQTNLVSDGSVSGTTTDPNLVNPWGLSRTATSPWWAADEATGVTTLYNGSGQVLSLVVAVPPASGSGKGTPAGTVVFNGSFVFCTLDGSIQQWQGGSSTVIKVTNAGAAYTGCTVATKGGAETLYVANAAGGIEAYDTAYNPVTLATGAFKYPKLPSGYAPYGIQTANGKVYVTYSSAPGAGKGFVGAFSPNGKLLLALKHGPYLNEPWGIALAPSNFGAFSKTLLVGNVGSGTIAAFNPKTGAFVGELKNSAGKALANPGLWAIYFGGGSNSSSGPSNSLYFVAGIDAYAHGLFGVITSNN